MLVKLSQNLVHDKFSHLPSSVIDVAPFLSPSMFITFHGFLDSCLHCWCHFLLLSSERLSSSGLLFLLFPEDDFYSHSSNISLWGDKAEFFISNPVLFHILLFPIFNWLLFYIYVPVLFQI